MTQARVAVGAVAGPKNEKGDRLLFKIEKK
jgi:hypothetical protein